jgi:hypothetical protein
VKGSIRKTGYRCAGVPAVPCVQVGKEEGPSRTSRRESDSSLAESGDNEKTRRASFESSIWACLPIRKPVPSKFRKGVNRFSNEVDKNV